MSDPTRSRSVLWSRGWRFRDMATLEVDILDAVDLSLAEVDPFPQEHGEGYLSVEVLRMEDSLAASTWTEIGVVQMVDPAGNGAEVVARVEDLDPILAGDVSFVGLTGDRASEGGRVEVIDQVAPMVTDDGC